MLLLCDGMLEEGRRRPTRRRNLRSARDVIYVIAQGDKQIKEELSAAVEHLKLHRATSLEGAAAADDEGEVVGAQLGVGVGGVRISIASGSEDGAGLDSRFCLLLAGGSCASRRGT